MAEDPHHDIIEAVRTRLEAEIETQLQMVAERHQRALEDQRNRIEAEAEQRWTSQLQAARAEVEHQAAAAAATKTAIEDLQQLVAKERALAESRLDEERRGAAQRLEHALQSFEVERSRQPVGEAAAVMPTGSPHPPNLVEGLRRIDAADSLSGSLTAIVETASVEGTRAALYVANGTRLEQWPVDDRTPLASSFHDIDDPGENITVAAFRRGQPVGNDGSCAIPLLLDGNAVAVLYGEVDPEAGGREGWAGSLETLARHGAARVGYLTALRTAQARQWLAAPGEHAGASIASVSQAEDTVASARRYARLVVSEIKLYNESAVLEGRNRRDLLVRLGPEIERARRLFEQRVPLSVPARADYFEQELIQTLAGGDPTLLG